MATKIKCPICNEKYVAKPSLYNHIEREHEVLIPPGMSTAQFYFNLKNKKTHGSCVMCKKETNWNGQSERYERFCGDPKCKEEYREQFKSRMIGKYGKVHLLDDPQQQTKMLNNRSISGTYKFTDSKEEIPYVASYEKDFLKFLDKVLEWNPGDIMQAPQVFYYMYEDKKKFYMPDYFIPSLNLVIEIKDGGSNPNTHHKIMDIDKEKERLKDELMESQKNLNFIKITDKDYSLFFKFLTKIKKQPYTPDQKFFKPIILLGESSRFNIDDILV